MGWFSQLKQRANVAIQKQNGSASTLIPPAFGFSPAHQSQPISTAVERSNNAPVQAAVGLIVRAFSAAEITPANHLLTQRDILPQLLSLLCLRGEAALVQYEDDWFVGVIAELDGDGIQPANWEYRIEVETPSGKALVFERRGRDILHCKYQTDPQRSYLGVSPLMAAGVSVQTLAQLERQLAVETSRYPTYFITMLDDAPAGRQGSDTESSYFGMADPAQLLATQGDVKTGRIGAEIPTATIELHKRFATEIGTALGVPGEMLASGGGGSASREGLRRFLHTTISPLGRNLERECTLKGYPCEISFTRLMASDLAGRSRALKQLLDSGVPMDQALHDCGFD